MLNIYYGRESVNREKFIYEEIGRRGFSASHPVVVLVPDQYTLEAEKQAFKYLEKNAVTGLDIYSVSRLGHNVLAKVGCGDITLIDKYGRQMLLTKVMEDVKGDLTVYASGCTRPAFIEKMNDFISEMKQYGTTPDELKSMIDGLGTEDSLTMKLRDMEKIYRAYDEGIKGKYTDSEDYVDLFVSAVPEYDVLRKTSIWVYGFDSFAPKSLSVLEALMRTAPEVNVVLAYSEEDREGGLFELTGRVKDLLIETAKESGVPIGEIKALTDPKTVWESSEIETLEHELFAALPEAVTGKDPEDVEIVEAANPYNEAESAAAYVLSLVRDEGYRYRDIVVICNDQEKMAPMLGRVFGEYGIPVFRDTKRDIAGSAVSVYILSMFMAISRGMRTEDVIRALKTGIAKIPEDDVETLENYVIAYRIDRSRWRRPFAKGKADYTEEELEEIERIRAEAVAPFETLDKITKSAKTYDDFIKAFYDFLVDDLRITETLADLMDAQNEAGLTDLADETSQVFTMIVGILEQIDGLMGEEPFDRDTFVDLFTIGMKQVEIGVLPPSPDDIIIGTMQRTRSGEIKAAVIVGANEGVLPKAGSTNGLFAEDELERLSAGGHEIRKVEKVRRQEERLAMYRNFSKPSRKIRISYSLAGEDGKPIRASEIVDDIKRVFPDLRMKRDVLNTDDVTDLVGAKRSTLRHLVEVMSKDRGREIKDPVWKTVLGWYEENAPEDAAALKNALGFTNTTPDLTKEVSDILLMDYKGQKFLSPTALENYTGCPFAYFVGFGLSPKERRVFEAGSREIGDVYHHALMTIAKKLTEEKRWDDITKAELSELIRKTADEERKTYRDGLFEYTGDEKYRLSRMEKTLTETMDILLMHARKGANKQSYYEAWFRPGKEIPPIEVKMEDGTVLIEGIIDRLDILENDRVKVMDYKSGVKNIDSDLVRKGYQLQLMLYMKAAEGTGRKPAGVFYFHIGTDDFDSAKMNGDFSKILSGKATEVDLAPVEAQSRKKKVDSARMKGMVIDDPETLEQIIGPEEESDGETPLMVSHGASGYSCRASGYMVSEKEFVKLQDEAMEKVEELIEDIKDGKIDISPAMIKNTAPSCQYCEYRGICRFDRGFEGCNYNVLK